MFQASFSLFGDWSFSLVFRNLILNRNEQASFSLNYLLLAQPVVLVSGLEMDKLAKTQLGSLRSPTRFFCRLPPFSWDPKHDSASSTILDKMNEKLRPPLVPFQWWKKWRVFLECELIIDSWGEGWFYFLFYFAQEFSTRSISLADLQKERILGALLKVHWPKKSGWACQWACLCVTWRWDDPRWSLGLCMFKHCTKFLTSDTEKHTNCQIFSLF